MGALSLDRPEDFRDLHTLPAPARRLASLVPLHQQNRSYPHKHHPDEAEGFKFVSKPPQHQQVAEPDGDGWDDNQEKRPVHRDRSPPYGQ